MVFHLCELAFVCQDNFWQKFPCIFNPWTAYSFWQQLPSSAWTFLLWTTRLFLCTNNLLHNMQLYGFLHLWTLICWLSWYLSAKDLLHNVQLYGFSTVWTLLWWLRRLLVAHDLPHTEQLYDFSSVWDLICWLNWLLWANNLPHNVQLYGFSDSDQQIFFSDSVSDSVSDSDLDLYNNILTQNVL
jgi:hypothetical protein